MFGLALPDRWRRKARPALPDASGTVERFLVETLPRLADPTPTLPVDGSFHVGAFHDAAIHHGLALRKIGERRYEIVRDGETIGRLHSMLTDLVGRDVVRLCADKSATVKALRRAGVPVPQHRRFGRDEVERALGFARKLGFAVVVKPCVGAGGAGVSTAIAGEDDFRAAWTRAVAHLPPNWPPKVVVESRCPGMDIRAVVVGGRFSCAATRMPGHVIGDGRATVAELIARKNAARQGHRYHARYPVVSDERLRERLAARGLSLDTVPEAGVPLVLAEVNNVHAGGDACEITGFVSARIRGVAEAAARTIPGLAVVGVDLLVTSLGEEAEIAVIEMNPRANFSIHFAPHRGEPRNPALDIVRLMRDAADAGAGGARREALSGEVSRP